MNVVKKKNLPPERASCIIARGGIETIVSTDDYAWLSSFSWFIKKSAASSYVCTRKIVKGKSHTVRMHRLIMQCPSWLKVHHINHNTLDNRRENLTVITEREHRHFDGWHIFKH
jgi:hypothetical protein